MFTSTSGASRRPDLVGLRLGSALLLLLLLLLLLRTTARLLSFTVFFEQNGAQQKPTPIKHASTTTVATAPKIDGGIGNASGAGSVHTPQLSLQCSRM